MAKEESDNQLNLTVVALVALVAIVGLVALVMNAASLKTAQLATGSKLATAEQNVGGQAVRTGVLLGQGGKRLMGPTGQGFGTMATDVPGCEQYDTVADRCLFWSPAAGGGGIGGAGWGACAAEQYTCKGDSDCQQYRWSYTCNMRTKKCKC